MRCWWQMTDIWTCIAQVLVEMWHFNVNECRYSQSIVYRFTSPSLGSFAYYEALRRQYFVYCDSWSTRGDSRAESFSIVLNSFYQTGLVLYVTQLLCVLLYSVPTPTLKLTFRHIIMTDRVTWSTKAWLLDINCHLPCHPMIIAFIIRSNLKLKHVFE